MLKWLRRLCRAFLGAAAARPAPRRRPTLEALETRAVPAAGFRQINLVADRLHQHALFIDHHLVNAWGIVASQSSPFWVNDNGTGLSTLYAFGTTPKFGPQSLVVTIPPPNAMTPTAAPTGIVFNSNTSDFILSGSNQAIFLFATEDGTISGWNPNVDGTHAILKVNRSPGSVYKGLALGSNASGDFLFATDFRGGAVDMFDNHFNLVSTFTDPAAAARGYAPFGIANFGGKLYVTFAKVNGARHDDVKGVGHGFVDIFDTSGHFLQRLISRGKLNSPWGLAMAPAGFGKFGGDLLVGNFGDGLINAYDPVTGHFRGQLTNRFGQPIVIDGLWGLDFGNNAMAGPASTLFFTAGPAGESHGLLGELIKR
jgi:uncharacterized protein (TIGR03118 family)